MKCLFDTAEEALRAALSGGTTWKAGKSACRTPKITTSTSSSMEAEMEAPLGSQAPGPAGAGGDSNRENDLRSAT